MSVFHDRRVHGTLIKLWTRVLASFIYMAMAQADLPWVYGGEYRQFSQVAEKIIKAWLAVGLRLYFVFDGMLRQYPSQVNVVQQNRRNVLLKVPVRR